MCISNWVNEAQDFIAVKKYDDLPNSLIPTGQQVVQNILTISRRQQLSK